MNNSYLTSSYLCCIININYSISEVNVHYEEGKSSNFQFTKCSLCDSAFLIGLDVHLLQIQICL